MRTRPAGRRLLAGLAEDGYRHERLRGRRLSEFEPDRRVVFTWDANPDGGQTEALSVVTVELLDQADGVEICVTHRELSTGQAVDMDAGWNNSLDSLDEYVRAESANWGISPTREEN